jgi:hypothetical protein
MKVACGGGDKDHDGISAFENMPNVGFFINRWRWESKG